MKFQTKEAIVFGLPFLVGVGACYKAAIVLAVFVVAGCAVPSSGVVPRGDNMYTVTRQGEGAWVSSKRPGLR